MLPDYPRLKSDLEQRLVEFCERRSNEHLGILSQSPSLRFFEGEGRKWKKSKSDAKPAGFEEISGKVEIKISEIPEMTLSDSMRRLDELAQVIAQQKARFIYDRIGAITRQTGSVVDRAGKGLSADAILDALRLIAIDFDENGMPMMPAIHIHPKLEDACARAIERLESEPKLREEMQNLVRQKRNEFNDREASRKLVG